MFTARNAIAGAVLLAAFSILVTIIQLLLPPDSGGAARDSYGTRAYGLRGLFDTARALNRPIRRSLVPPAGGVRNAGVFVLWAPDPFLVQQNPGALQPVRTWMESGGRVVLVPARRRVGLHTSEGSFAQIQDAGNSLLNRLGLPNLRTEPLDSTEPESAPPSVSDSVVLLGIPDGYRKTRNLPVRGTGSLSRLAGSVRTLCIPQRCHVLTAADTSVAAPETIHAPSGTLQVKAGDAWRTVAAEYPCDAGSLLLVTDEAIFANSLISRADNAVLALSLLASDRGPAVVDEFFHGLTVRGNPAWLLTKEAYGVTALSLLLLAGAWAWRRGVRLGPALPAPTIGRRSIREYVEAMAHLFERGRHYRFVLQEMYEGVLWTQRRRLHLGPTRENADDIAAALARRTPEAARRFLDTARKAEATLAGRRSPRPRDTVAVAQEMSQWL